MKNNSIEKKVCDLVCYGINKGLTDLEEAIFSANLIFDVLGVEPVEEFDFTNLTKYEEDIELDEILKPLLDYAVKAGIIEDRITERDLLDTRLMSCITPRPSEVIRQFNSLYEKSYERATDYFYKISKDSDYIRSYRIKKDKKWQVETPYGKLDITINLSKPEKDPKAIAQALKQSSSSYPKCLLCKENIGYHGRINHPARQTIRYIPIEFFGEKWYFQYSPYVYYNEHCIVFATKHSPMKIDRKVFDRLLLFVEKFPHYILGSNADLAIVGGSILTHDHYQGGRYTFAMERAKTRHDISFCGYEDIKASIIDWPMSAIRIRGNDRERLSELADKILLCWRDYSDESLDIISNSNGEPHNTITPIARRRDTDFELDLVLRNNRTSKKYPFGIFHPHEEFHHIKKENIGLIEVMGLAILPPRLLKEIELLQEAIRNGDEIRKIEELKIHEEWAASFMKNYSKEELHNNTEEIIKKEVGLVFLQVLKDSGVYKDTTEGSEGFMRFVQAVNGEGSDEQL